jgi:hypothetical protein
MSNSLSSLTVTFHARTQRFDGRLAWALAELISAGQSGITPITHPGPRWAAYCFKLRQAGLDIETVRERHEGAYAGHHARYVLRTPVVAVEQQEAA